MTQMTHMTQGFCPCVMPQSIASKGLTKSMTQMTQNPLLWLNARACARKREFSESCVICVIGAGGIALTTYRISSYIYDTSPIPCVILRHLLSFVSWGIMGRPLADLVADQLRAGPTQKVKKKLPAGTATILS